MSSIVLKPPDPDAPAITDHVGREFMLGGAVAGAFFVVFLGWAAFAPLDAGAYATGVVTVAGNRQSVQHREGGVVSALHVQEGDHVRAGQVLLEVNAVETRSVERSLTSQVLTLTALTARLQAERDGLATVPEPAAFASLSGEDKTIAADALRLERLQLAARRAAFSTNQSVLSHRVGELAQQQEGFRRQIAANTEQSKLIEEELSGVQGLAAKGYAPKTRVLALQRAGADLKGQAGSLETDVARSQDAIGEARMQLAADQKKHLEDVVDQLRQAELNLAEAQPKLAAAREALDRSQVKAPATGKVVGLSVFTVGGVVAPGQKLMDIVPDSAALVMQAQVSPNDADDIKPGQLAEVRFPSFHERDLPRVEGKVTKLSADSFTDEKTGKRFFSLEVVVPPAEMAQITRVRGKGFGVRPGLPVQIVVRLRKRTALQYIFEPMEQRVWKSLLEH